MMGKRQHETTGAEEAPPPAITTAAPLFPSAPSSASSKTLPPATMTTTTTTDPTFSQPTVPGQALLVAGSAVGAGLLALPSVTRTAGLVPSILALTAVCAYMSATASLLLEAASWTASRPLRGAVGGGKAAAAGGGNENLLGMSGRILGPSGRTLTLILYVVVYAATLTAYVAEGGRQFLELTGAVGRCVAMRFADDCAVAIGSSPSKAATGWCQVLFAAAFGSVIRRGPKAVERVNAVCMVGWLLSFVLIVRAAMTATTTGTEGGGADGDDDDEAADDADAIVGWSAIPRALPVMVVAFSFHNMVPSVHAALSRDALSSRKALLLGSGGSLLLYVAWQIVALGGKSVGGGGKGGKDDDDDILSGLRSSAGLALPLFCFLALVTSTLGVGLGCVDFAADALSSPSATPAVPSSAAAGGGGGGWRRSRTTATLFAFVPALSIAVAFPDAFLPALEFSGIFRQILFGAMPVAMVWTIRSAKRRRQRRRNPTFEDGGEYELALLEEEDRDDVDVEGGIDDDGDDELYDDNDDVDGTPTRHRRSDRRRKICHMPEAAVGDDDRNSERKVHDAELLPGEDWTLGLVAAVTAVLAVLELEHVARSILSASDS